MTLKELEGSITLLARTLVCVGICWGITGVAWWVGLLVPWHNVRINLAERLGEGAVTWKSSYSA